MAPVTSNTERMPVLFLGHGSPMNAITETQWSRAWQALGQKLPRPRAIVCISAHWYVPGTAVTAMPWPRTIHDFRGFPQALYEVSWPAPGDPELAQDVCTLLAPTHAQADYGWGLDHGAWSVLIHMYPQADVPVIQLSIDRTQTTAVHYELGKRLRALRDQGVLLVGSGSIVHNLRTYVRHDQNHAPFDWAERFDEAVAAQIVAGDHEALIHYQDMGSDAELSAPTPEHFLPLLYVVGASYADEAVSFPATGFDGGSISMRSVQIG